MRCFVMKSYLDTSSTDEYTITNTKIKASKFYGSLSDVCDRLHEWDSLVLDDDFFHYYSTTHKRYTTQPVTIHDLKKKISELLTQYRLTHTIKAERYHTYITSSYAQDQPISTILWATWSLECTLMILCIPHTKIPSRYIHLRKRKNITIQSLSVLVTQWLTSSLAIKSYILCYIYDTHIHIVHMLHDTVIFSHKINLGISVIKNYARERHISHLLFSPITNQLSHDLLMQVFWEYCDTVCKRLSWHIGIGQDIYISTSLLTHPLWMGCFESAYKKYIGWYAVPLHPPTTTLSRKRRFDELVISLWRKKYEHYEHNETKLPEITLF